MNFLEKKPDGITFANPEILIMSGPPGSGKSTLTKTIKENGWDVRVCSADDFFVDPISGEYRFDASKIGEAHNECFKKFLQLCQRETSRPNVIVIDNTNTQLWEITPYVAVANAYKYNFTIVRFLVDPEVCAARNVHGVSPKKVKEMAERARRLSLPKNWNVHVIK